MSTQNQKRKTNTSTRKRSGSAPAHAKKTKKAPAPEPVPQKQPLLGARVKNDLIGVIITIVAIVLFVIVVLPSDAVGSQFISNALHLAFGQGALLLPFLLLGWAATFFIRRRLTNTPVRLAIGLGVIYLALIAIFGATTPGAASDPSHIFNVAILTTQGGYLGGAIAWALLSLFGMVPTVIVLIGLILIGLILIGLSITGLVDWAIRSIKGLRKGKTEAEFTPVGQAAAPAVSSGSAYQMGPQDLGRSSSQGRGRQSAGAEAQLQMTEVMGSAQLQDTLYRPSLDAVDQANSADLSDLGSTRRRKAWEDTRGPESIQVETIVLDKDDEQEGTLDAPLDVDAIREGQTVVLTGAQKESGKKKKTKQQSSSKGGSGNGLMETSYMLPNKKVLRISREKANTKAGASELRSTANQLQATMEEFKVDGEVVGWIAGPTVTLYKISLGEGVRLNRITALQSDIQLALAAKAIRIVAPIPGTSLVGIEIPNQVRNEVLLGDVLDSARDDSTIAIAIGKDVEGESIVADLASMPHLLIGGSTGSGKSVGINSIIMSLLMRTTPDEVRMIMIDPKRVELTLYNGIPHLYVPVVTDAGQAASALAWCVAEMDRRLKLFEKHAVKNIKQFNEKVRSKLEELEAEKTNEAANKASDEDSRESAPEADTTGEINENAVMTQLMNEEAAQEEDVTVLQENLRASLPYLVIVIDELADLMMLNGKEVETSISRLAQLARAAGLHLVVATQRPSTNVLTGLIKANIINRIAFTVASGIDSRVILDTTGAEDLIGLGDMLFSRPEYSKPVRIQGCLVSESEIETVVEYWRGQGETDYHEEILLAAPGGGSGSSGFGEEDSVDDDPLLWEAAEIVVSAQLGSTSTLQRRLKVGYARAGRIMDMLEMKGIVGPPNGSKPREVLVDDVLDLETLRAYG